MGLGMNRRAASGLAVACGLGLMFSGLSLAQGASVVHSPPKVDDVRARVLASLNEKNLSEPQREQVAALWMGVNDSVTPNRLLDLVIRSFALGDAEVGKLVQDCNSSPESPLPPKPELFNHPANAHPFLQANLNLFYGRCLVERRLFDEAWEILKTIDAQQVVDPASLFFFQAVSAQGMLEIKPALEAINELLTNTERVPVRYSATATLMQADLQALKEKSLGELARLMSDSERRLELGRAGEKVQGVQERIIANLDEIIKKVEQEQGGGGGGGGGGEGGNDNNPSGGSDDSRVKGQEAPGETDKKRFENKGSWGNLPEKDLAKAKNDLNKNFPSHYEQAIEKYTNKLAGRAAKKTK